MPIFCIHTTPSTQQMQAICPAQPDDLQMEGAIACVRSSTARCTNKSEMEWPDFTQSLSAELEAQVPEVRRQLQMLLDQDALPKQGAQRSWHELTPYLQSDGALTAKAEALAKQAEAASASARRSLRSQPIRFPVILAWIAAERAGYVDLRRFSKQHHLWATPAQYVKQDGTLSAIGIVAAYDYLKKEFVRLSAPCLITVVAKKIFYGDAFGEVEMFLEYGINPSSIRQHVARIDQENAELRPAGKRLISEDLRKRGDATMFQLREMLGGFLQTQVQRPHFAKRIVQLQQAYARLGLDFMRDQLQSLLLSKALSGVG